METKDLFKNDTDQSLLAAFAWWEKRRIIYNVIVGAVGIFFFLLFPSFTIFDVLGTLFYGIIANLFYCLGFIIEVAAKYYFKSKIDFTEKRQILFSLGLIFSILVTAGLASMYGLLLTPHPN